MRKVISIMLVVGFIAHSATAEEYLAEFTNAREHASPTLNMNTSTVYFRFMAMDQSSYINQIDPSDAGTHIFGEYMAKKQYLFKKMYSYTESIAPGSSATKMIYRKPDIYFSVKKIEKYLKEELKKENLTAEDAKKDYNKVLDVALNILEEDTESFERRINTAKGNASNLLRIFVSEVELNK